MPKALDPFRITDKLEAGALDVIVARLEARGHHPRFTQPLSAYLDRMGIDARAEVLDLGCGTGIAARAIAQRPGFHGSVLGIDLSDHLISAARRLTGAEGLDHRLRFETGDSQALGLRSESFDAVVAHTLLSHLGDPAAALAEMRRVLRPGGVAGIFDGDYASMTFELDDEARSRRMDDAIVASIVTQPRILRRLPRLLIQAGFAVDAVLPTVITEVGAADFWKNGIESFAKLVPGAGILGAADTAGWAEELMGASRRGEFFGSCVYYAYVAHAI